MANVDVTLQLPVLRREGDNPIHTVKHLQEMLVDVGKHDLAADDQFGPKTEETVRIFQQNNNLQVDGIVGRETWQVLLTRWVFGFSAG